LLDAPDQHLFLYRAFPNRRQTGSKAFGLVVATQPLLLEGNRNRQKQGVLRRSGKAFRAPLAQGVGQFRTISVLQMVQQRPGGSGAKVQSGSQGIQQNRRRARSLGAPRQGIVAPRAPQVSHRKRAVATCRARGRQKHIYSILQSYLPPPHALRNRARRRQLVRVLLWMGKRNAVHLPGNYFIMSGKTSNTAKAIIGILLLVIAVLAYQLYNTKTEVQVITSDKELLISQLEDAKADLMSQTTQNDSLNAYILDETARLNDLIAKAKSTNATNTKAMAELRRETIGGMEFSCRL
jgi:hypothetical protein